MKNTFFSLFLLVSCTLHGQGKNYEFKNGQWFNGQSFTTGTWYSVNGVLSQKAPSKIDSVINLSDKWVIPPFADAFSSSIADNSNAANVLKLYMGEGVFYVQAAGNTQAGRSSTESLAGKTETPDVSYTNGAVTCSLGHPFVEYEGPASGIKNPTQWGVNYDKIKTSRLMLGDGYWFIDNKTALNANWDKIKAQKPAALFICLLDAEANGGKEGKGLSAEMAKVIVKKAHGSGLRVWAHVENAADLRLGLKLGVDGFANLPGSNWDGSGDAAPYNLTDEDLKKLAKKKTPVVPLFSHAQMQAGRTDAKEYTNKTLNRLFSQGVNVVIGSDDPQRTIRAELNYWYASGAVDHLQVLKVICENTPKAVYPKRKIARIAEGYEASFIVVAENPLQNVLRARVADFKLKQGAFVR